MNELYKKTSKKIWGLIVFVLFIFSIGYAQIIAPDFSLTDTHGNTYHLYQELDAGKIVVLDFFTIGCGPCANGIYMIEPVWQNAGADGSHLWIWGIESFYGTNSAIDSFISNNGGSFPGFSTIGNEAILALYQISYTPRYFVIRPDRSMKTVTVDHVQEAVNSVLSAVPEMSADQPGKSQLIRITPVDQLSVKYYSKNDNKISFELYDMLGNLKNKITVSATKGYHTIDLMSAKLVPGYYILRMLENSYLCDIKKFTVN
ncbi:MAG: redoxin domain-containing protein [Bacteroidia bacterium]|nr:redoxin domain-containing protein [Bacteroidia bacterium]